MPGDYQSLGECLIACRQIGDVQIPLAEVALWLGAADMPGLVIERYQHYLAQLGPRVGARHHHLLQAGADDDVATQVAALKHILADEDGFVGDHETYDLLDNANLIRVIDRRRGLPIALAILYLHAAWAAGFAAEGLNFPGHFLLRVGGGAQRLIIDPFDRCAVLGAPELRDLLKQQQGPGAELSASYYQPASRRDILIRLQNNIKLRQIAVEDYAGALRTVERMRQLDPDEFRLLLDAGVLYAKLGQAATALPILQNYIDRWPTGHRHRLEAQMLYDELRRQV